MKGMSAIYRIPDPLYKALHVPSKYFCVQRKRETPAELTTMVIKWRAVFTYPDGARRAPFQTPLFNSPCFSRPITIEAISTPDPGNLTRFPLHSKLLFKQSAVKFSSDYQLVLMCTLIRTPLAPNSQRTPTRSPPMPRSLFVSKPPSLLFRPNSAFGTTTLACFFSSSLRQPHILQNQGFKARKNTWSQVRHSPPSLFPSLSPFYLFGSQSKTLFVLSAKGRCPPCFSGFTDARFAFWPHITLPSRTRIISHSFSSSSSPQSPALKRRSRPNRQDLPFQEDGWEILSCVIHPLFLLDAFALDVDQQRKRSTPRRHHSGKFPTPNCLPSSPSFFFLDRVIGVAVFFRRTFRPFDGDEVFFLGQLFFQPVSPGLLKPP